MLSRRAFLTGVAAAAVMAEPAAAWMIRRSAVATTTQWLYAFSGYANEAAAKADLAEFVTAGNWNANVQATAVSITGQSGFQLYLWTSTIRTDLFDNKTNCIFEFSQNFVAVTRSRIVPTSLATTNISPSPLAFNIHTARLPNGLAFWQNTFDPVNSYMYKSIVGETARHFSSDALIDDLVTQWGLAAFGINTTSYSTPCWTRGQNTPLADITPQAPLYPTQSQRDTYTAQNQDVPFPTSFAIAGGTDREASWSEPEADTLLENWQMGQQSLYPSLPNPTDWGARRGGKLSNCLTTVGIFDNPFRNSTGQGVAASGLPMVPIIPLADDVALAMIWRACNFTVISAAHFHSVCYPGTRTDGATNTFTTPNKLVEGMRLGYDPSFNVDGSGLHPVAKYLLKVAQQYGWIITDRGGSVGIRLQNPLPLIARGMVNPWTALFDGTQPYDIMDGVDPTKFFVLPSDYGDPTWTPAKLENLAWRQRSNPENITLSGPGTDGSDVTAAWDISHNSVEMSTNGTNPKLSQFLWTSPNRVTVKFNNSDNASLTSNATKRFTTGVGVTELGFNICIKGHTSIVASSLIFGFIADGQSSPYNNAGSFGVRFNAAGNGIELERNSTVVSLGAVGATDKARIQLVWNGTHVIPRRDGVLLSEVASTGTFGNQANNGIANLWLGNLPAGSACPNMLFAEAEINADSIDMETQAANMSAYFLAGFGVA